MSGWFDLGSVHPDHGRIQGQAARTRLELSITVTISDVRVFMGEPEHRGRLDATITFLPLGRDLRSTAGTFNLLAPTSSLDCRVMTFECAFEARGTRYYLAARTEVPAANGTDVLRDSTTVPVTLHEGAGTRAAIVGAGVLTLSADDMARLVTSIRVTGAESLGDSTLALTGFGRFFLGELWEEYAHPAGAVRRRWNTFARRLSSRR